METHHWKTLLGAQADYSGSPYELVVVNSERSQITRMAAVEGQ